MIKKKFLIYKHLDILENLISGGNNLKITHIALCGPVTDNFTYQDNLLPKYHKRLGHEVSMITSQYIFNDEGKIIIDYRNNYINENGIRTIRIPTKFKTNINSKFKRYEKLYQMIEKENPDIIFVHGVQFIDILQVRKYIKYHSNTILFIDNHADFSNSATNWISKVILHKIIWRTFAKLIEPYTQKFYGVLPARVEFLSEVYNIDRNKSELLLMGADDDLVIQAINNSSSKKIREKFDIKEDDCLIVTGGKIDKAKQQTLLLLRAVKELNRSNIKLILFGSISSEFKEEVEELIDNDQIHYVGWISSEKSYEYFEASDLVVFPGRHSVYWEQVVGQGKPLVVKWWDGTNHIDIGGNVKYLYEDSVLEIKNLLLSIVEDTNSLIELTQKAQNPPKKQFLYSKIAEKSIENELEKINLNKNL